MAKVTELLQIILLFFILFLCESNMVYFFCSELNAQIIYSLMRGRIKGPRPLVNPMQSDKTFITWVIKILHGNGAPKATNLRLATRMSLPAATIMQCTDCISI